MAIRPFGQSRYSVMELRVEELTGVAFKFSLLLPTAQNGTLIFSPEEEEKLRLLFEEDFGGYTCTYGVTHPLLIGGYIDKSGARILNQHTRFEVYSKQSDVSIRYFTELSNNLVKYSQNTIARRINGYAGEEKILIELMTVRLL